VHYDADHRAFAELAGDFAAKEVAPNIAEWEADGIIPREAFAKAGAVGLLGSRPTNASAASAHGTSATTRS
jgi:alkylation response protein AidB-like acyl-CoA dehydrogenase